MSAGAEHGRDARARRWRGRPLARARRAAAARRRRAIDGSWLGAAHERGHRLREAARSARRQRTRRCAVADRRRRRRRPGGGARLAARPASTTSQLLRARRRSRRQRAAATSIGRHGLPAGRALPAAAGARGARGAASCCTSSACCAARPAAPWPTSATCATARRSACGSTAQWHDGLLPPAERGSARERQYRRFAALVAEARRATLRFAIPSRARRAGAPATLRSTRMTFAHWLDAQASTTPRLRWYLDYACRDDYGAGSRARLGLGRPALLRQPPRLSCAGRRAPTPSARPCSPGPKATPGSRAGSPRRWASACTPARWCGASRPRAHEVALDVRTTRHARSERWIAQQVVLAVPLHVAARIVAQPPAALAEAAARVAHAPWLVANLHLRRAAHRQAGRAAVVGQRRSTHRARPAPRSATSTPCTRACAPRRGRPC